LVISRPKHANQARTVIEHTGAALREKLLHRLVESLA
jgi:hypothetical protein